MRRMSLKIVNRTEYKQADLRRVLGTVHREFVKVHGKPRLAECLVKYSRNGRIRGMAHIGGNHLWMQLPSRKQAVRYLHEDMVRMVAKIFWHELLHNAGYTHRDMVGDWQNESGHFGHEWSKMLDGAHLTFETREPRGRKTDSVKLAALRVRFKRWQARRKLAVTYIKKIERQIKYYERKEEVHHGKTNVADCDDQHTTEGNTSGGDT